MRRSIFFFASLAISPTLLAQPSISWEVVEENQNPFLAVKTNLCSDMMMTPSIEFEVPLTIFDNCVSFQAEYAQSIAPDSDNFSWNVSKYAAELRLWQDCSRQVLSGWFMGVFSSYQSYDLRLSKSLGREVRLTTLIGVSTGYSQKIVDNWHIEYSVGLGLTKFDYERYDVVDGIRQNNHSTESKMLLLPVRAKVSLVWLLR